MANPNFLKRLVNNIWLIVIILIVCTGISIYLLIHPPTEPLNLWFTVLDPDRAKLFIGVGVFVLGVFIAGTINLLTSRAQESIPSPPQVIVPPIEIKNIINHPSDAPAPVAPSVNQKFHPAPFLPDLKFFVGREELLKKIKDTLATTHRAAIHDISGLGKTFTTYKFAEDNLANYEKIFFIRATREEMLESLAKCGELVEPGLAKVTEQQVKALGFKQWLEENEKWLVIYDNVDLPDELFKYIPVSKKGDCIFTSNFREVNNLGTEISIVKLDKTDAEILLYSRANNTPLMKPSLDDEERAAFDRLIVEIDGLPLTLNSTGALIDKKQGSFATLWQRYERSTEILWESEDDYSVYQRRSAGIVFSLAYDELSGTDKVGDAVKILLDSISFISPDEIPEDLLRDVLERRDGAFAEMEEPDDLWDDIRARLTAYDLLKYDKIKKTFTTHRAIQRVIQSRLKGEEKDICIALASVLRALFPLYDYSNRDACENYYQHVLILLENADRFGAEIEDTNELYYRAGRYQRLLANYVPAEKFHLRASEISASIFGTESETQARDLNDLALVYGTQGRYDEAIEKYEQALSTAEKTIGREHLDYASCLNNLAGVYQDQGRYEEAIEKYEEALRIDEKTVGREHQGYAIRLNNLGEVYRKQGRYKEAMEKYEESLRIGEKNIGREHPHYASPLTNLANIYYEQHKYEEAIEKYEEALRIAEKTIGREHPDYAINLSNLACVYLRQGRYDEAIEKFEEALRIAETSLGREHPDYAARLNNLGAVYREQGRYDEAIEKFEEALRIGEKTIGRGHPDYATRLNNLGHVYYSLGRFDEAMQKLEEATRITENALGSEHPDYATRLSNMASVCEAQRRFREAFDLYKNALQIFEKALPEGHPHIVLLRSNVERCGKLVD